MMEDHLKGQINPAILHSLLIFKRLEVMSFTIYGLLLTFMPI